MQKVEGSSPFSRFGKGPQRRAFCLLEATSTVAVSRNRLPNVGVQHRVRGVRDVSRGSVERIMSASFAGDLALSSGTHVRLDGVTWPSICRVGEQVGNTGADPRIWGDAEPMRSSFTRAARIADPCGHRGRDDDQQGPLRCGGRASPVAQGALSGESGRPLTGLDSRCVKTPPG
jgi:hypothetical protein